MSIHSSPGTARPAENMGSIAAAAALGEELGGGANVDSLLLGFYSKIKIKAILHFLGNFYSLEAWVNCVFYVLWNPTQLSYLLVSKL